MKKKNMKSITTIEDINNYLQMTEREIYMDILSPQIANQINKLIRFWNIEDDNNLIPLSSRTPIKIFINSLGGSLDAALTICDTIKLSKTPIYTYNIGHADLESLLILLSGHKRLGYLNSTYIISDLIIPKTEDTKDNSAYFIKHFIETLLAEKTTMQENQIIKYTTSGKYVLTSEDAQKLHIINQIVKN